MKKLSLFMMALLFVILSVGVSCSPESAKGPTVNVTFDIATDNSISGIYIGEYSCLVPMLKESCYWSYSAVKNDSGDRIGETNGFVNCSSGPGLGESREFSPGAWTFTLKVYASAEERKAGKPYFEILPVYSWNVSNLNIDGIYTHDIISGKTVFTETGEVKVYSSESTYITDNTIELSFGQLKVRAIDESAYTTVTSTAVFEACISACNEEDYYWAYTATKDDSLFKTGEKTEQTACATGTGFGESRAFSSGKWHFELFAYASPEDRTEGTRSVFHGGTTGVYDSDGVVYVPVGYSYSTGSGTVEFTIDSIVVPQVRMETSYSTYLSTFEEVDVTKVVAVVDGEEYVLTQNYAGIWTGTTGMNVHSGIRTVELKIHVNNESYPRFRKELGLAIILNAMTTEVAGKAVINLSRSEATLDFVIQD